MVALAGSRHPPDQVLLRSESKTAFWQRKAADPFWQPPRGHQQRLQPAIAILLPNVFQDHYLARNVSAGFLPVTDRKDHFSGSRLAHSTRMPCDQDKVAIL